MTAVDLAVELGRGLVLPNPVGLASGTAGYGFELSQLIDISRLGAIYTKGTTADPRPGNAPPRVAESEGGMLNSIGLQNPGIDAAAEELVPKMARFGIPIIVNVAGADINDYVHCVRRLEGVVGVAAVELNISCPNIANGLDYGRDAKAAARLVRAVRGVTDRHIMVKLSPNVTDIAEVARAVESAGADSVSAVNTYLGMKIDRRTGRPVLAQATGGLSGPAIHPLALAAVRAVAGTVRIPVVAAGGIHSVESALDFFDVGAAAVQVGTANFVEPGLSLRVVEGLAAALRQGRLVLRQAPAPDVRRTAVRLLILDDRDYVLLLHYRTPDTGEDFWCTPGGALEPGETEQEAAHRELLEETGQPLGSLGPVVFERQHVFRIGDGRTFQQHERYHMQRMPRFTPDSSRVGEFEASALAGHRWWAVEDLATTSEVVQPPGLAALVKQALAQGVSSPPAALPAQVGP